MNLFDLQIPFMRPLWRRYVLVGVCLGWSVVEFATGVPLWGCVFGAMGVYAVWQLFIAKWP